MHPMDDIRFGSLVAYEQSGKASTLLLMEWRVEPSNDGEGSTNTDFALPTDMPEPMALEEEISWETTRKFYLLCTEEAENLFVKNRHKIAVEVGECSEVFWIAQGVYYFRQGEVVHVHAINLITGELTPGLAANLKKYPLTAKMQYPMVKCELSLEEGLLRVRSSLPSPLLFSSGAIVFTPIFTYPRKDHKGILVYDPMLGRVYQSAEGK